jgi:hypothetical protein
MQNPGYAHVLKIQNLKNAAQTLNYLAEQGIDSYSLLEARHMEAKVAFDQTREEIKKLEVKMSELSVIAKNIRVIEKSPVLRTQNENKGSFRDYSVLLDAAIKSLKEKGIKLPYPSVATLVKELSHIKAEKEKLYQQYNGVKREWKQIQTVRKNVEQLLQPAGKVELIKE